jgi:hypothetical protein
MEKLKVVMDGDTLLTCDPLPKMALHNAEVNSAYMR